MSETYYKIWLHIEKINEEEDLYEDLECPMSTDIHYTTEKEAKEAQWQLRNSARKISEWSAVLQYPDGQLYIDYAFARTPEQAVTIILDSLVTDSNNSKEASDMEVLLVIPGRVNPILWQGDY